MKRVLLVALLALLRPAAAQAEDWPQFRGPNRDGMWGEDFPVGEPKVRWRQPAGWGWSSPVVAQGRVFLTDAELQQPAAKERVRCFEAATGKLLWTHAYGVTYPEFAFVPGQGGGPTATPVVEAGRVYVVGANGHVHCLAAAKGAVLWERDLRKDYEVREMQCRPSPLIEGRLLILFVGAKPGAGVLALDKQTGKEVWRALDDPVSNSSPVVIVAGGQRQLIVWTASSLASLDPATGAVWWREPMVTSTNDGIPTPVVRGHRLLVGGLMLELEASRPAVTVLWPGVNPAARRILSNTSTALWLGDHLYSAKSTGQLVCLEAGTGRLVWQTNSVTDLRGGASIHLTPSGDGVFLFTNQGNLIRAQLTPQGYREFSRAHLLKPTTPFAGRNCAWVPPAYANGHAFARNDEELVCATLTARP